jgi:hypothetical protein
MFVIQDTFIHLCTFVGFISKCFIAIQKIYIFLHPDLKSRLDTKTKK